MTFENYETALFMIAYHSRNMDSVLQIELAFPKDSFYNKSVL